MSNGDVEFCCECGHSQHRLRICDAYRHSVSIEVWAPEPRENLASRIIVSLRYIFTGQYSENWTSFILKKSDIPKLITSLQKYADDSQQSESD